MKQKRISQKTINKMGKFAKLNGLRFGQLIINIVGVKDPATFYIDDSELEARFLEMWDKDKPNRDRGGYYPHGHNDSSKNTTKI